MERSNNGTQMTQIERIKRIKRDTVEENEWNAVTMERR